MGDMETVFLTGANGWLASFITNELLERGYKVRGGVRGATNEKKMRHILSLPKAKEHLELVDLDMIKSTQEDFINAFKGVDYVIHTASVVVIKKLSKDEEDKVIATAVEGTSKVVKAIHAINKGGDRRIKKLIYTTSVAAVTSIFDGGPVPPGHKRGEPIRYSEEDWTDTENPTLNSYAKSKVRAEKACWDLIKEFPEDERFACTTIAPSKFGYWLFFFSCLKSTNLCDS